MTRFAFYRLEPNSPLPSSDEVRALAAASALIVSDDYAYFCSRFGAGAFEKQALLPLPPGCALGPACRVDILYSIGAREDWNPLALLADTYEDRLPSRCLPIGTDPGGNLLLLGTEGRSGIYVWDHEHRELADGDIERRAADPQSAGIDAQQLDIDQLILVWEELFPGRVPNPSGHGNLYRVADMFVGACRALCDRMP